MIEVTSNVNGQIELTSAIDNQEQIEVSKEQLESAFQNSASTENSYCMNMSRNISC